MEELLYHHQVCIDACKSCLDASGYLQTVAGPEKMFHTIGVFYFLSRSLEILHTHITVGIGSSKFANFLIDYSRILCIGIVLVQFKGLQNGSVTPAAGKHPVNLHDGAVYLDAKKVFGLSCYGECGTECYLAIYATDSAMTNKGVATP